MRLSTYGNMTFGLRAIVVLGTTALILVVLQIGSALLSEPAARYGRAIIWKTYEGQPKTKQMLLEIGFSDEAAKGFLAHERRAGRLQSFYIVGASSYHFGGGGSGHVVAMRNGRLWREEIGYGRNRVLRFTATELPRLPSGGR